MDINHKLLITKEILKLDQSRSGSWHGCCCEFVRSNTTGEIKMQVRKCFHAMLTAAAVLIMAAPAQATLQARYLDGIAGVDAYYDSVQGITWLRDVHHGAGSVTLFDPSHLIWNDADAWATGLGSGWRLPTTVAVGDSEMGNLWTAGDMTTGHFPGLVTDAAMRPVYWSNAINADNNIWWFFSPGVGTESYSNNSILAYSNAYAMAVHAGDVGRTTEEPGTPVPEPESILLLLSALGALALVRRKV
ncbi:PEP-CTERM sorting domain-containing protein [Rhodoferax sp.]|uniref:PEP-CTERM sorting domain-containing protein n=1 Tax=Rhodoferax sp. TaxID=50421 RepID=UPI0039B87053